MKEQTENKNKKLSARGRKILYLAIALVLVLILTNPGVIFFLPDEIKAKLTEAWSSVLGEVSQISQTITINWVSIFKIVVIVLFLSIIAEVIRFILSKVSPKTNKGKSVCSLIYSYTNYAVALVGIVWGLQAIGVNLSAIFASLGIVALIIGFAAESLIADIITGVFLVFEDDFNVGDIVEISGFRGVVTSIGVRVTTILDLGGNVKVVNNSDIRNILNRSKASSKAVCDVSISYSADLDEADKAMLKIMESLPEKYPEIFKETPVYCGVQSLDTSAVILRCAATVREQDVYIAQRMMNREIKVGLDAAGIEIPFNQIVVHNAKN